MIFFRDRERQQQRDKKEEEEEAGKTGGTKKSRNAPSTDFQFNTAVEGERGLALTQVARGGHGLARLSNYNKQPLGLIEKGGGEFNLHSARVHKKPKYKRQLVSGSTNKQYVWVQSKKIRLSGGGGDS